MIQGSGWDDPGFGQNTDKTESLRREVWFSAWKTAAG